MHAPAALTHADSTRSSQEKLISVNKGCGRLPGYKPPPPVLVCGSVPDEGSVSEDRIAPPSPEDRDSGLFMLKKDSERRAILFKVLNEDQAKVISNLRENYIQVTQHT